MRIHDSHSRRDQKNNYCDIQYVSCVRMVAGRKIKPITTSDNPKYKIAMRLQQGKQLGQQLKLNDNAWVYFPKWWGTRYNWKWKITARVTDSNL